MIHVQPCKLCAIASSIILVASNAWAWATSLDVGATATAITAITGAVCGAAALIITTIYSSYTKAKTERIRGEAEARANAWATQERLRIQVQAERDKAEETSLTKQLETVRAELNGQLERARVSLHEIKDKANADVLQRDAQILDLKAEIVQLKEEIKQLKVEEQRLLNLLIQRSNSQGQQIADNSQKIEAIEAKAGTPTGGGPAA